ncbi:phosphate ABC transporter permease subunit PstC [Pseudonocardia asaccharolytica]|uniref:Phosphate transport system permease protein n=1 Tax=Pseudonocardia asaccharolytica DSM 44247 = NBRC 16224 TaxID=1123024 RepID=A0A511D083_9PSEU|nr:phosphate ABC transporter permease subunit PstC [Pseudonocardia asaccharolytica]GEL18201.1 phosphate transport system permease protein [Pseudonocardia asaccharolytica DSM 44247 = NBRC 16224]
MTDPTVAASLAGPGDPGDRRGGSASAVPATTAPAAEPAPSLLKAGRRTGAQQGDRIFRGFATGSGAFMVALIGAIGLFLLIQAVPSLLANKGNFLTGRTFEAGDPNNLNFGILELSFVTVEVSIFALVLAMPVGLGIALFLTQYAPRRVARPFAYLVDLLAAVPSIIFGLWGAFVLAPAILPIAEFLNEHLGWFFLFQEGNVPLARGANVFTAGIVLAVMILPIITAISREVFERTPRAQIEAALALGATKWEVVRTTVLPFGRAGYISASMLGLGRALGETIALMIILAATPAMFSGSLFDGGATFASMIALSFAELNNNLSAGAFIAAGLVLFVLTFVVNAAARLIIARSGAKA